jgi:hypothetical protein
MSRSTIRLAELLANYEISPTGCWLWLGYVDKNGYGRAPGADVPSVWVHRASYEHVKGEIPPGYEIDHTCQVTRCMNPDHLDAVTRAEHVARTMRRLGKDDKHLLAARMRMVGATYAEIAVALGLSGKQAAAGAVNAAIGKGLVEAEDVPRAKYLNDCEREEIRELYALGFNQPLLARMYLVDNSHISRICAGQTSGHSVRAVAS